MQATYFPPFSFQRMSQETSDQYLGHPGPISWGHFLESFDSKLSPRQLGYTSSSHRSASDSASGSAADQETSRYCPQGLGQPGGQEILYRTGHQYRCRTGTALPDAQKLEYPKAPLVHIWQDEELART